eukprot:c20763_g8_i2.p1 GENE.c20763_g8_i2~~c20763_g8_i2.p1  ORF type:complete len:134 (-),score=9.56 c20763_g8_i2:87-488(-)
MSNKNPSVTRKQTHVQNFDFKNYLSVLGKHIFASTLLSHQQCVVVGYALHVWALNKSQIERFIKEPLSAENVRLLKRSRHQINSNTNMEEARARSLGASEECRVCPIAARFPKCSIVLLRFAVQMAITKHNAI